MTPEMLSETAHAPKGESVNSYGQTAQQKDNPLVRG